MLGNEAQFRVWIEEFLIQDGFLVEESETGRSFYSKTSSGELSHSLPKNGNIMQALLSVSGKRLERSLKAQLVGSCMH